MWELDYKESWALKNWCLWAVVLEKTLESPLDSKEIQAVHPKGDQSWIFIGRSDAEAETPALWSPDEKNWFIWKDFDAGKDGRQGEREMIGWDGWMASPTQWTWVWVGSRRWWMTGKPGVLQSMGSQRVRHYWATELTDWLIVWLKFIIVFADTVKSYTTSFKWIIRLLYKKLNSINIVLKLFLALLPKHLHWMPSKFPHFHNFHSSIFSEGYVWRVSWICVPKWVDLKRLM